MPATPALAQRPGPGAAGAARSFATPNSPGQQYFGGLRQAMSSPARAPQTDVVQSTYVSDSAHAGAAGFPDRSSYYEPDRGGYYPASSDYGSAYGCCDCSDCSDACACGPSMCGTWQRTPCVTGYVDWLYLQVTDADVAHAQQQNGIGGSGTVPFGEIGTVDQDFNSGIRTGFTLACNECSQIGASYTYFESDSTDRLSPPFIPGGGGAIGSLVHHPGAAITASAGPVVADYEVDFQLADLTYRHVLVQGCNYSLHYLVGAQFGHLDQEFRQSGVFSGGSTGTIDTTTDIKFDGGGLKVGLDGERRIGCGFLAYGRLTAAALSGRFRSHYDLLNSSTDVLLAEADWRDDRVISQVEYELGVGWSNASDCFRVSAGYMFSHWGNVVTTPEFIDAVQAGNYTDVGDTLSFDGLVTRMEFRY